MRKSRFIALAVVMGVAGIVAMPLAVNAAAPTVYQRLSGTLLGRFVVGQIGRLMVLRSELEITTEQRAEIRDTVKAYRPQIAQVAKPIVERRRALRQAVLSDTPNEETIRAAAEELGKAIGDAAVLASKVCGNVRGMLTEEQIHKIIAFQIETAEAADGLLEQMAQDQ
jgi:Spy/CpxP family protein refolding chaperone